MNLKQLTLTFCFASASMLGLGQTKSATYTVTGNLDGVPNGAVIDLIPVSHDSQKPLATATVANGKFVFKGTVKEPLLVFVMVEGSYGTCNFMLENRYISLRGKVEKEGKSYIYDKVNVTGSPLTLVYRKKASVRDQMDSIHSAYYAKYSDVYNAMMKAESEKNKAAQDSIGKTEAWKAFLKADNDFFHTVETSFHKNINDNKDTFWGPLLMISLTSYLTEKEKPQYEAFSQKAKDSYYGKMVKNELYPAGFVRQKAPDFVVKDTESKEIHLSELVKGHKYLLIDFWASWCHPCRKEIPNLKAQYQLYGDKGLQIVSISTDKVEADWKKALNEEKLSWPNFRDTTGSISDTYKIRFIPKMFLVNSQGIVVAEDLRGEVLANKLKEVLK
jgi:peroxiredoxin